ncbi:hypothetical protein [Plantactinospora endophytica]|uniref:LytR family transcriptional regulator n=1 Tax=Plantactinospora endophytica TaxID=673535 RepID=A0ABQ4DRU9_9ACTN|nr:hypothetical protein [Plantactinospora endophytica]GIG85195.1 hypothetical protein Pen02_01310 [Plantactinospora endophytica]
MRGWWRARRADATFDLVGPATTYPAQRGGYAEGAAPAERQPPDPPAPPEEPSPAGAEPSTDGEIDEPDRAGGTGRRRGYRRDGIGR